MNNEYCQFTVHSSQFTENTDHISQVKPSKG